MKTKEIFMRVILVSSFFMNQAYPQSNPRSGMDWKIENTKGSNQNSLNTPSDNHQCSDSTVDILPGQNPLGGVPLYINELQDGSKLKQYKLSNYKDIIDHKYYGKGLSDKPIKKTSESKTPHRCSRFLAEACGTTAGLLTLAGLGPVYGAADGVLNGIFLTQFCWCTDNKNTICTPPCGRYERDLRTSCRLPGVFSERTTIPVNELEFCREFDENGRRGDGRTRDRGDLAMCLCICYPVVYALNITACTACGTAWGIYGAPCRAYEQGRESAESWLGIENRLKLSSSIMK